MARLPNVQGVRPTARPSRAIAQVSPQAAASVGDAISGIGQEVTQFGEVMFDRETTAIATERDTMVSEQIRDLLYNPETGFTALQGQAAVGARTATIERLEALKSRAFEGLNGTAKRKLESSLNRRLEGAMSTVERHTLGARDAWLDGASDARMSAAYQDSLANPSETSAALSVIESEVRARGIREGWGAEKTQIEVASARSKVYADQATRIASANPIAAMEYLRKNEANMMPSDVVNLELKLQPEVKKAIGRHKGAAAASDWGSIPKGFDWAKHTTQGGNRPDAITGLNKNFQIGLAHMISSAPPEIREGLQVYSGYRSPQVQERLWQNALKKYGSAAAARKWVAPPGRSNHNHGNAADLMWNGQRLDKAPAHVRQWIHANASQFGLHFPLSNEAWHVEIAGTRGTKQFTPPEGGLDSILEIPDPVEREAALDEYNLRISVKEGQEKASLAAAQDAAFQMIESGGSLDSLPVEVRQSLGQKAMTSLRSYQATIAKGGEVETDDETYYELRKMQANDPAGFRSANLMEYRDKLDDADWQKMVDAQTKPGSKITRKATSTLMTVAARQLTNAGFDATPEPGSSDAEVVVTMQSSLLRWQDEYIEKNGTAPTETEINARVARELTPLVIDAPGFTGDSDKQESTLIQLQNMNLSATELAETSIWMADTEVPASIINEQIIALQQAGEPVTAYNLSERILRLFEAAGIK